MLKTSAFHFLYNFRSRFLSYQPRHLFSSCVDDESA